MFSSICQQSQSNQSSCSVARDLQIFTLKPVNAVNTEMGLNAKPDQLSQTIHFTLAHMAYVCKQSYIELKVQRPQLFTYFC